MEKGKEKFTINDNTVSAVAQLAEDRFVSFLGNEKAKRRILIIGNSITRHGPKPDIGWHGDFGMAASAEEKDYVHLLAGRILEKEDACIMVHQLSMWEHTVSEMGQDYSAERALPLAEASRAFAPDLLIFRLGENIKTPTDEGGRARLEKAFSDLVSYINPRRVLFTTCFWKHGILDEAIRELARKMGMPLVELSDLGEDDAYMAVGLFAHGGVAHHPGDLGMATIAERIYGAMEE